MDRSLTPVEKAPSPADVPSGLGGGEQDIGFRQALEAAMDFLGQGEALLLVVAPEDYTHKFATVFGASIGCHYRHCLDHFVCLLNGKELGLVDYDQRERDSRIEALPECALEATRRIRTALQAMATGVRDRAISTRCRVSYREDASPVTQSTLARELVHAVTHGIHHFALISVMARLLDAALPPEFGVAPSTVAHRRALLAAETGTP